MTIASGAPAISAVSLRASSPSCALTRGSAASRGSNWPWPTSTATTERAPRVSSTSVKPPVEAPTSRQARPRGIELEGVERGGELEAAARGPGMGRARLDPRVLGERVGGLAHFLAVGADQPGGDRRLRARAAGEEAAFDEQKIGALAHAGQGEGASLPCAEPCRFGSGRRPKSRA